MDFFNVKTYYEKFFPSEKIFKWLKINENREISFTLKDGLFFRYQTFNNVTEFNQKNRELNIEKIDVGAIYDVKPEKNKNKTVQEKELVFDIDLTDYERRCCVDKSICKLCIPIIKVSVELLEYILKKELGFKSLSFVFSGRRGLHCWVNDWYTTKFTEEIRSHIISYIEKVTKACMYSESYTKILLKYKNYLLDQNFIKLSDLEDKKIISNHLKLLYDKMFLKIDLEVTKSLIHLIKMPFCVHPSSKLLSLPIDPNFLDGFETNSMVFLKDVIDNPNVLNKAIKILDSWIISKKQLLINSKL